MVQNLDLEEQEQLDQLKHFWKRYGNLITGVLVVALGAMTVWNGWQYWQRKQALGASVLFDEIERATLDRDASRMNQAWADLKSKYSGTAFAQQGALLVARGLSQSGQSAEARAALDWAAAQRTDEGLQSVARLRLVALALEQGRPDEALKVLEAPFPADFEALAQDRRGDAWGTKGQASEARAAYQKAYALLDDRSEYRRLVEVKLNALGADVAPATSAQ